MSIHTLCLKKSSSFSETFKSVTYGNMVQTPPLTTFCGRFSLPLSKYENKKLIPLFLDKSTGQCLLTKKNLDKPLTN